MDKSAFMTRPYRYGGRNVKGLVVILLLGSLLALPFLPRFGQDPDYHRFADQRTLFGVPNFWDVISNVAFVAAGLVGLRAVRRAGVGPGLGLTDRRERAAWLTLFIGAILTGLGSAWYHLDPRNGSLFWDRLPLAVTSVSVGLIVVQERLSLTWARRVLWPVVGFAAFSVLWWSATERTGHGDLRMYSWCLAMPCVAVACCAFLPSSYTGGRALLVALALYLAARVTELLDHEIMALPLIWSGHTWKHVFAAATVWTLARWLARRTSSGPVAPPPGRPLPRRPAPRTPHAPKARYPGHRFLGAELVVHPLRRVPAADTGVTGFELTTSDGINLKGCLRDHREARGTLLLVHGLGKSRDPAMMRRFDDEGYRVVSIDLRAHGESGGRLTTFGLREAQDVDAAVSWIRARWPDEPMAALGVSMGAAALCCSVQGAQLDALILESPYSSLLKAYANRLKMWLPDGLLWLGTGLRWAVELRLGVEAEELDLVRRVRALDGKRVLIVTGSEDRRATVDDLRALAGAIPGSQTLIVDGASHNNVWARGGPPYVHALKRFLRGRMR